MTVFNVSKSKCLQQNSIINAANVYPQDDIVIPSSN